MPSVKVELAYGGVLMVVVVMMSDMQGWSDVTDQAWREGYKGSGRGERRRIGRGKQGREL